MSPKSSGSEAATHARAQATRGPAAPAKRSEDVVTDAPLVRPGVRLGVDVGEVRIGVAASDPSALLAVPVETVRRDATSAADLDQIVAIATAREVLEVVVGLPRTLAGAEGVAAQRARDYAAALHRALGGVPVRLWDERLSTVQAHRTMRDAGVPGRAQRARVDQAAAVLILQSALDAERLTGRPPGRALGERKPRAPRSGRSDKGRQA